MIVYIDMLNGEVHQNSEIEQARWIDRSELEKFDFYGNELEKLLDYFNSDNIIIWGSSEYDEN